MIHDITLDTETTGLQAMVKGTEIPGKHDVIQIAALCKGEVLEVKCQPIRWDSIAQQALDVHGYQINDLKGFMPSKDACIIFRTFLANTMTTMEDRFRIVAHNMPFDYKFVKAWFFKNGFTDWENFFLPQDECICTKNLGNKAKKQGLLPGIENMKLITAAMYIGFEFDAHDALGDTLACEAFHKYLNALGQETEVGECSKEELEADGHVDVDEPVKGTGSMVL